MELPQKSKQNHAKPDQLNSRKKQKIEHFNLPANDIRSTYPKIFESLLNGCQKNIAYKQLKSICSEDCIMVTRSLNNPFGPNYREVHDIDAMVEMFDVFVEAVPDCIFSILDSKIYRKDKNESTIVSSYTINGQMVYTIETLGPEDIEDLDGAISGLQMLQNGGNRDSILTGIVPESPKCVDQNESIDDQDNFNKNAVDKSYKTYETKNSNHFNDAVSDGISPDRIQLETVLTHPSASTPNALLDCNNSFSKQKQQFLFAVPPFSKHQQSHPVRYKLGGKIPVGQQSYRVRGTLTLFLDAKKKVKKFELYNVFDTSMHRL